MSAARKIILRQDQSPGDVLTMSGPLGDLKKTYPDWSIDVESPCPALWEYNPHLTPLKDGDEGVERFNIRYPGINDSGWRGFHFSDAFREEMERQLKVKIKKTGICPELYLSEEEKGWINQVEAEFGWAGPFWLLNAGHKPDNELKQYPYWQSFVLQFNSYFKGSVRLVQIGHGSHKHPKLSGVYSLVGKTDLRQLIRLGWWAHGTIGPISFQFVMSAAFRQPHVVVAGGKEGVRWHMHNFGRYLHTNGALKCCSADGCWKGGKIGGCVDQLADGAPRCFSMIRPRQVLDAVRMYYEGGMLSAGQRDMNWRA